jgi:two-component system, chemotaxis family, CheB/CheR fusion protein
MRNGSHPTGKKGGMGANAAKRSPVDPPAPSSGIAIVGIGASAGGLEACRKFVEAVPANSRMAYILVQHLDPAHESMMVDLLANHTSLVVLQAVDGAEIEPDHLYVIPPGTYLSIVRGRLQVSPPTARHGARLPFDFLLHAMADELGARAVCVVLSGTGADGSLGLRAVKAAGGLVVAQDPDEAGYGGMPRSAILTGAVDLVLPVAQIPQALIAQRALRDTPGDRSGNRSGDKSGDKSASVGLEGVAEVVDILRTMTSHDFTHYKTGTLSRRIERRMGMSIVGPPDLPKYLEKLRSDASERDILANDLLINVTQFFRDREVFDLLAEKVVPDLLRAHKPGQALRVWVAGCSTGEETYSLAMIFKDAIAAARSDVKLQIFASDVDSEAIVQARDGHYPDTIVSDVNADRLKRFFTKEDDGYRVLPELRSMVVFTVQDLLADPPFSKLDFVSCRNLLIYLSPEAQAKVVALFNFALNKGGILLLGGAETIRNPDERFEEVSKTARIYRHVGNRDESGIGAASLFSESIRAPARPNLGQPPSRQASLADLCRRLVLESFAPAAVLINRKHECLFSLGPVDRYLRLAQGPPTHDLLAMIREGTRVVLRETIERASRENVRVVAPGGRIERDGVETAFNISAQAVLSEGEQLFLICFIDAPKIEQKRLLTSNEKDETRVSELEHELEATRLELQAAIRNLDISTEDQRAINEEALSVNEEYQSTNEELLTSKEELQSLNEELIALNGQLQETLERQRTTSTDLKNVLYSTDVATIFLDRDLKIRLFTPATRALFSVIPGDIGRPLSDLHSLAADPTLLEDSKRVLVDLAPVEREFQTANQEWFMRKILPYRSHDESVMGVVITFNNVTERKRVAVALEAAKLQAEQANLAKSRFLAAASHDLRQPLQTLALVQGLLAKTVDATKVQKLVVRLDETLGAMSGMLNTLLDINQIESGVVQAEVTRFPLNDILIRLRDEFTYYSEAQEVSLRFVPCGLTVSSDRYLLEQILRNLLSNALKYAKGGKVLVGCRRRAGKVVIEVCDSGIGIPETELDAIFDEYHQVGNVARERNRGLGLGLSIVKRLGILLGHKIAVRSKLGEGSKFSVEILDPAQTPPAPPMRGPVDGVANGAIVRRTGTILVVEDDPEVRELVEMLLVEEGHRVTTAADGVVALELVRRGTVRPDMVLADYNLPKGVDGLQVVMEVREKVKRMVPAVILSGDVANETLRRITHQNCVHLSKPIKVNELSEMIQRALPDRRVPEISASRETKEGPEPDVVIHVVDDDEGVCEALSEVLEADGHAVRRYSSSEAFLADYLPGSEGCLLVDAYLPGMSGLELLRHLRSIGDPLPSIMITGSGDVPMAVDAMKAGAIDFIEKPIGARDISESVGRALDRSKSSGKLVAWQVSAAKQISGLSARQRQIMEMVLAGNPSKNIAADLGLSQRTVENHRAAIMRKTGAKSLPALARLALAAVQGVTDPQP